MKRFAAIVISLMMLCLNLLPAQAMPQTEDQVTVEAGSGYSNVDFGNSNYGFCLDYTLAPAAIGDEFIVVPAQGNTWSNSETDTIELSDEIKLLFVEYCTYLYVNNSGQFQSFSNKTRNSMIWCCMSRLRSINRFS